MATYSESDFGQISGRWGEYVGASWLGRKVLRRYPTRVPNPRTPVQQANRGRFATAVQLAKGFLPAIRLGYGMAGPERSAYNHFISAALSYIFKVPGFPAQVNYAQLPLSVGSLLPPQFQSIQWLGNQEVQLTWSSPIRPSGPPFLAVAAAVLVGGGEPEFALMMTPEAQQQGTLSFPLTPQPGQKMHGYLFASDPVTGETSSTAYQSHAF